MRYTPRDVESICQDTGLILHIIIKDILNRIDMESRSQ